MADMANNIQFCYLCCCLLMLPSVLMREIYSAGEYDTRASTLHCRRCDEAGSVDDCPHVNVCQSNEACYMQELITHDAKLVYTGGCIDRGSCSLGSANITRRTDGLIACHRCCENADNCNTDLCGIKQHGSGNVITGLGKSYCRYCNNVQSLQDCTTLIPCDADEVCYMEERITEQLEVVYYGGCRARTICSSSSSGIVGKRRYNDLVSCMRCCDDTNDCNAGLCGIH